MAMTPPAPSLVRLIVTISAELEALVSVPLKETKASNSAEMVTINLTKEGAGGVIAIQWGDMMLTASFKVK